MFEDISEAIFWAIPIISTAITAVFLVLTARKDGSRGKLMFAFAFALASVGYTPPMLQKAEIPFPYLSVRWAFIPMMTAIHIVAISGLLNWKDLRRPFLGFLIMFSISVAFLIIINPLFDFLFLLVFSLLTFVSVIIFGLLILKERNISDIVMFMSFACFIFSVLAKDIGLIEEYTVLLSLFTTVFLGLTFAISKASIQDDLASIIFLQNKLKEAREELKQVQKEARKDLQETEERYRILCEEANFVIVMTDRRGRITYVNKMIENYGLHRDGVVGKKLRDFVPRKYWPKLTREFIKVIKGTSVKGEIEVETPIGTIVVEYRGTPIRHKNKVIGLQISLHNITERKEKEEKLEKALMISEEKLRNVFNSSPDGIIVADSNGRVIECNEAALKMHGFASKNQLVGREILTLIAEKDRTRVSMELEKARQKNHIVRIECELLTIEGNKFHAWLSASILKDYSDDSIEYIFMARDITERKKMQDELIQYSQNLERLVEEKTIELRKKDRLATIGQLAGMVAHDLRNPLTAIAGATYYVKNKLGLKADKKIQEMLETMENALNYCNKIVSELLDYSREIKLELADTNPKALVAEVITLVEKPKHIKLIDLTEDKPIIKVDVKK